MKIQNETRWRTDHLRAFVARVAEDELDVPKRKMLIVKFISGGRRRAKANGDHGVTGFASIGGVRMRIGLPGPTRKIDRVWLARTIAHEMGHIRGLQHPMMRQTTRYGWADGWRERYAWADAMPLDPSAAPAPATLADRRGARLEHAREMVATWERRTRQAQGRVRKWKRKAQAQ